MELTEDQKKMYDAIPEEDKVVLRMKVEELTKLLPVVMMITHNPSLSDMLYLGTASSEYCEKFKCSPMQFIKDLQDIRQAFIESSINQGIGFGSAHTVPKHMQKKNNKNYNRGSKPVVKSEPSTATIGDMLKAKGITL